MSGMLESKYGRVEEFMSDLTEACEPIVYNAKLVVRFSDLDPYGHVNASHFFDYVVTSRWVYSKQHLGIGAEELIKLDLGFYLSKSNIEYKRPIIGIQELDISSFAVAKEGKKLHVAFEIRNVGRDVLFSNGQLEFAVIDLKTMRSQTLPDWANKYFFDGVS